MLLQPLEHDWQASSDGIDVVSGDLHACFFDGTRRRCLVIWQNESLFDFHRKSRGLTSREKIDPAALGCISSLQHLARADSFSAGERYQ
jgi:hypothetical protein